MDYTQEKQSLQQAREWWKPIAGKHTIKILSEPESYETEWEDKVIQKVRFEVEVEGKKFSWGVTKGITENSLYGQLVLVGASKGKLKDETVTLLVKGSGKDTEYTVEEALALMTPKEEKV
jgi:hypothetical protein